MRITAVPAALLIALFAALLRPPPPPPDGPIVRIAVVGRRAESNVPPPVLRLPGGLHIAGIRRLERATVHEESFAVRPVLEWSGRIGWDERLAIESPVTATVTIEIARYGVSCTFSTWEPGRTEFHIEHSKSGIDVAITQPDGRAMHAMCLNVYRPAGRDHTG